MSTPEPPTIALRNRREEVIEILCEHFSQDHIDVDEFERRVDQAHRAERIEAIDELIADLEVSAPEDQSLALVGPKQQGNEAMQVQRPADRALVTVLSGTERRGQWRVPENLRVYAIFGGAVLDFREVILPPGPTEVRICAVFGGVEIIVPPNLPVECDGIGIMGGFQSIDRAPPVPDPERPLLKITGLALLGGFDVQTRLPGESARDAKRRRRRQLRRARRRRLRA